MPYLGIAAPIFHGGKSEDGLSLRGGSPMEIGCASQSSHDHSEKSRQALL